MGFGCKIILRLFFLFKEPPFSIIGRLVKASLKGIANLQKFKAVQNIFAKKIGRL
jgi:hypothetical protein